ncbi:monofunctional biosynthetic peptidoglycan transglycosylase [Sphingomonadaceae bacterium jetA1]|jgi:monofunctional biosynthetic peptidoglycan transglycosylase|uniref:monofunctional biosynthetic peptidoglycan transglycosylase n=1 Tax=Facivitalis istanbulensis TaxID=3075838 RepID=UPI003494AB9C
MFRIARWAVKAIFAFVILSVVWVGMYRFVPPPFTFTMLGDVMNGRGVTKDWMPLSEMDPDMARAAIAGEDARFCSHHGFDIRAIENAAMRNAKGGRIRGGSTISQQTAKNAFLFQNGGYVRKAFEAWFTFLIEHLWGKRRIMEVYLNIAETGIGTYGANAGAMRYFGHDASHLSPIEAARIAAVLPLPKKRDAVDPTGFVRKHGNVIARYVGVVRRQRLDACLL